MLTDMHVLESGSLILLDVPEDAAAATVERLDQFIFTEDVTVGSLAGSMASVWVHGPEAARVLTAVLELEGGPTSESTGGPAAWRDYQHARGSFDGAAVSVARIDQLAVPGFCVYVDPALTARLGQALETHGARTVGGDALTAARVEAGYPVFGVDMTETTIPLEAGIEERAISFSKGCYVGQEVVIRVLHRGGGRVAKKLVTLRIDGPAPLAGGPGRRGAKLFAGERAIGELTTAADSPRFGAIALGYVHRDFTTPGTAVDVELEGGRRPGLVVEKPLFSSP
jgi:folate-binding protein YgfZ